MFLITALFAAAALALYVDRTGWLLVHGEQNHWAVVVRAAHIFLLSGLLVGLLARGMAGDDFAWFHWPILLAFVAKVVGHLGLRGTSPT